MSTKLIEYAYPTSTTAKKSGYYKTGCWFVSLYKDHSLNYKQSVLQYFGNKQDAVNYADTLPNEYNYYHKYFNDLF